MMTDYLSLIHDSLNHGASILQNLSQTAMQQQELDERKRASQVDEAIRTAAGDRAGVTQKMDLLNRGEAVDANNTVARQVQVPTGLEGMFPGAQATTPQMSRVPVDPARVVSSGGTSSYIPTQAENEDAVNARALKAKTDEAHAMLPYTHVMVSPKIAELAGIQNPLVPHGDLGHVLDAAAKAVEANHPAAPAPKPLHFQTGYDAKGNMTTIGRDPATGDVKMQDTQPGMKAPKVAGGGGGRGDAVQDRFDQRELDKAQAQQDAGAKQHGKLQELEQEQHRLRTEYGQALIDTDVTKNPNAEQTIIDPKSGKEVTMNPARRKFYEQQIEALGGKAAELQKQQTQVRQRYGLGEFAPPTGGSAGPTQQKQQQTQQPAAAPIKTASMDQVNAYAKAKGLKAADAVRAFQAEGYKIGQ